MEKARQALSPQFLVVSLPQTEPGSALRFLSATVQGNTPAMGSFTFTVPQRVDKKKLHALIEAQLLYERMNEARLFFIHSLATIGALLWLCLGWPTLFSQSTQAFLLTLWDTCGLVTFAVSLWQWVWHRRRVYRLTDYEATPREGAR